MFIIKYLRILLGIDKEFSLRATLIKESGGTFALMIISSISNLMLSLALARILGPYSYGILVYAITLIGFMVIITVMGLDRLLVRNIAAYNTNGNWELMKGLILYTHCSVSITSLAFVMIAAGISWFTYKDSNPILFQTFCLALILLPLYSLAGLRQAALRGLHKAIYAKIPEAANTLLFLIMLIIAFCVLSMEITPQRAISLNVLSMTITFSFGCYWLIKFIPMEVKNSFPQYLKKDWIRSALPLLLIGGIELINSQTDILMLGALHNKEMVGIYSVARRGSLLILFIMQAANAGFAPIVSSIYVGGELKRLQEISTRYVSTITILSIPIALGMIFFGTFYLKLFGSGYESGKLPLIILSIGQLSVLTMSSAGTVLIMTGHERETALCTGCGALGNIIMNALFIPKWGMLGASIATMLCNIFWGTTLLWIANLRLGIFVFPIKFKKKI
jgi:O-antigen/teichoic acid export membrane protein